MFFSTLSLLSIYLDEEVFLVKKTLARKTSEKSYSTTKPDSVKLSDGLYRVDMRV